MFSHLRIRAHSLSWGHLLQKITLRNSAELLNNGKGKTNINFLWIANADAWKAKSNTRICQISHFILNLETELACTLTIFETVKLKYTKFFPLFIETKTKFTPYYLTITLA